MLAADRAGLGCVRDGACYRRGGVLPKGRSLTGEWGGAWLQKKAGLGCRWGRGFADDAEMRVQIQAGDWPWPPGRCGSVGGAVAGERRGGAGC